MTPTPDSIAAYFNGQSSAAEEAQLARSLTTDAALADAFVEQAKIEAGLQEIFRDQPAANFHAALIAKILPATESKPLTKAPASVVRGPFPYWKQLAAVLAIGLFLWGISSVWYGASTITSVKPRTEPKPIIARAEPGAAPAAEKPPVSLDTALEAWLANYYVGGQSGMTLKLEDWLNLLVDQEFPRHNHLNKHRDLTWEIRAANPKAIDHLAQQTVQMSCSPSSLLNQVRGLAALAGCEVHLEPDKFVLTPMKESGTALETRDVTINDKFLKGETAVSQGVVAQQEIVTWDDHNTWAKRVQADVASADFLMGDILQTATPDPKEMVSSGLRRSRIDWPEGAEVLQVSPAIQIGTPVDFGTQVSWGENLASTSAQGESTIPQNFNFLSYQTNTPASWVASGGAVLTTEASYQVNLRTSPRAFRQLEILNQLNAAPEADPAFQVTEFVIEERFAPREKDRVLVAGEVESVGKFLNEASVHTNVLSIAHDSTISPTSPPLVAEHFLTRVLGNEAILSGSSALPETSTGAVQFLGITVEATPPQTDDLTTVASSDALATSGAGNTNVDGFILAPNIRNWSFVPQPAPASQATLELTRSGELLKISGAINLPAPPLVASTTYGEQSAPLTDTFMGRIPAEFAETGETPPSDRLVDLAGLQEAAPTPTPPPGVDISLSLFPGQGAIVTGPTTDGMAHYYLLKRAQ